MKIFKNLFAAGKQKLQTVAAPAVGVGALLIGSQAHAAFTAPTAAATAWSDMGEAWTWVETNIWTVAVPIVVGFFILKLFKKGANKVS